MCTSMELFFKSLFDYNHHFNQLLIAKLIEYGTAIPEKAIYLLNHVINAHQIWNCRLTDGTPFGVYQIHELDELLFLDKQNFELSLTLLKQLNLESIVTYRTSKGEQFSNTVRDIHFHVINHSTYHRAQIATACKINGIEPLATDYIFYKRLSNFNSL